jgi:hypothetical protein
MLYPLCEINYNNYINTQSICNLEIPLECGIWSKLLTDYKTLVTAIETVLNQYSSDCGEAGSHTFEHKKLVGDASNKIKMKSDKNSSTPIESESSKEINDIKVFNRLSTQLQEELDKLQTEAGTLQKQINDIENQIQQKNSDNLVIEKALTNVDNPLDCTVYENQLTELTNFNYTTYCNTTVYGSPDLNNGTKQTEYNNCITSKTLENQNEEVLYSQLLEDCRLKNSLETQLRSAKFENNTELVNELEKQIQDVTENINRLTTDYNNSISYDESKQKSTIENNDIQNTINRTAELLNTTPKSITDDSNNLVLTDSQKVNLNIIYTKNKSQISDLNIHLGEKNALLTENLQKQNQSQKDTKNQQNNLGNLGSTLFNWGVGLIGLYYTLKGYLDPEAYGVTMAAINTGPIKGGGGPGGGGGGNTNGCVQLGGTQYTVIDSSSPTGYWRYTLTPGYPQQDNNADIQCPGYNPTNASSWVIAGGGGTSNVFINACCTATRVAYTPPESGGGTQTGGNTGITELEPDKETFPTTPSGGGSGTGGAGSGTGGSGSGVGTNE